MTSFAGGRHPYNFGYESQPNFGRWVSNGLCLGNDDDFQYWVSLPLTRPEQRWMVVILLGGLGWSGFSNCG